MLVFGRSSLALERPLLALELGHTVALWAYTEAETGKILSAVLGADAEHAVEEFINKRSASKQRELLVEYAAVRLSENDLPLLHTCISLLVSDQRRRNKIVHGLWGVADELPNAAILMQPGEEWRHAAAIEGHLAKVDEWAEREGYLAGELPPANFPRLRAAMHSYTVKSFERLRRDFDETRDLFSNLNIVLGRRPERSAVLSRAQMHSSPRFERELSRLRTRLQNPQEEPEG